jgi:hypothetical protein
MDRNLLRLYPCEPVAQSIHGRDQQYTAENARASERPCARILVEVQGSPAGVLRSVRRHPACDWAREGDQSLETRKKSGAHPAAESNLGGSCRGDVPKGERRKAERPQRANSRSLTRLKGDGIRDDSSTARQEKQGQQQVFRRCLQDTATGFRMTSARHYGSTMSWPFIPPWPSPQRLQHLNEYVPGVCATNSTTTVAPFSISMQSCFEANTRPGSPVVGAPSG